MENFENSSWADDSFADNYLKKADVFIPDRGRMFELMLSVYGHFSGGRKGLSICDLGCGNGVVAKTILGYDPSISATLVDASEAMLDKARENLSGFDGLSFIHSDFQELLDGSNDTGFHDAFVSAQAIHHLTLKEKSSLFGLIFSRLNNNGLFINIDVVLPPSEGLEGLYFDIWSKGMILKAQEAGLDSFDPQEIITAYKEPVNKPDTIEAQLDALNEAGFENVDCYFKHGIFVVFGGQKK